MSDIIIKDNQDKIIFIQKDDCILCSIEVCKYNIKHECYYKDNILVRGDCEHKPTIIKV